MTTKTDFPVAAPHARADLFREIVGILLCLFSLIIFLSLLSAHYGANWIGPMGRWIAGGLTFIFGQYVVYVLPVIMGVSAVHSLRGRSPNPLRGVGWLRGVGGFLILISTCALLTLSASGEAGTSAGRAFGMGGLVGNVLIDAKGLGLGNLLGPIGACVVLGGLELIGIVLFTERLVRDLTRLMGRTLSAMGAFLVKLRKWPGWGMALMPVRWVSDFGMRLVEWVNRLREMNLIGRLAHFLQVKFNRQKSVRVLTAAPILELTSGRPANPRAIEPPESHFEAPNAEARSSSTEPDGTSRRSFAVFPRSGAARRRDPNDLTRLHHPGPNQGPGQATEIPAQTSDSVAMEDPVVDLPVPDGRELAARAPVQPEMNLFPKEYQLPPLDLLSDPPRVQYTMSDEEKERVSRKIEQTLDQFKVDVEVVEVVQGPVITRFALKVAPGVRLNRIVALENELAMALRAPHVRILAPIPGQSAAGIEVPNKKPNAVMIKDLLSNEAFAQSKSPLTIALGKNIAGEAVICDLAKMPHLLIAGATGSGKSVCLNAVIASLLYRNKPDQVKFVMIDPKRVELSIYQAIPHLLSPVVSETRKAAAALAWCVEQMEQRYKLLAELGVRNLEGYHALVRDPASSKRAMGRELKCLPHIVIIIDELADLMVVAKNEVEEYIIRLAQMARAVGMHLVLATQRPSVNVITGIIKANFPSRIAFQVSSKVDSRTILDMNGAEALMGRGDMLYSPGGVKPFRIQGCFVADAEVERLADYIREQEKARYEKEDFEAKPTPAERAKAQMETPAKDEHDDDRHPCERTMLGEMPVQGRAGTAPLPPSDLEALDDQALYQMALRLVLESRKASVSYIQRRMKIGYARAGRIMDMMEENGIVGPYQGSKPRELIVDPEEFLAQESVQV